MGKTYYEEKAEELLAKRGEQENPKSLSYDMARWLEAEHHLGYLAGLDYTERRMRELRQDLFSVEKDLREAARAGVRCGFEFPDGKRCCGRIQHDGGHYSEGVVP